ncbi:MAG: hypothetical protein ACHREM_13645 [Polyangiales bacterium]
MRTKPSAEATLPVSAYVTDRRSIRALAADRMELPAEVIRRALAALVAADPHARAIVGVLDRAPVTADQHDQRDQRAKKTTNAKATIRHREGWVDQFNAVIPYRCGHTVTRNLEQRLGTSQKDLRGLVVSHSTRECPACVTARRSAATAAGDDVLRAAGLEPTQPSGGR